MNEDEMRAPNLSGTDAQLLKEFFWYSTCFSHLSLTCVAAAQFPEDAASTLETWAYLEEVTTGLTRLRKEIGRRGLVDDRRDPFAACHEIEEDTRQSLMRIAGLFIHLIEVSDRKL